jgi:hypothetical protein
MDILPPLVPEDHPDRQLWCEFALQAEFLMVAQRAGELGWGEREIAAALVNLADHNMLALIANGKIDDAVSQLKRRK